MRDLILSMFVTLDGFAAGPAGELEWFTEVADEELDHRMADLLRNVDGVLLGRATYDLLGGYWPNAEHDASTPAGEAEVAPLLNAVRKIVITTTPGTLGWGPVTRIGEDVADNVSKLKQESGKDLVCFGGARTAQTLMDLDLIDEYRIVVHPILLGAGQRLFDSPTRQRKLTLLDATPFEASGATMLRYRAKPE